MILKEMECGGCNRLFVETKAGPIYPSMLEYKDFIDEYQNSILMKRSLYGLGDSFNESRLDECHLVLYPKHEEGVKRLSIPSRNHYTNYRLCISKIVDFINIFIS